MSTVDQEVTGSSPSHDPVYACMPRLSNSIHVYLPKLSDALLLRVNSRSRITM